MADLIEGGGSLIDGGIPAGGGGGTPLTVTDGSTTINNTHEISITGGTVTSGGSGVADVTITGGASISVTDGSTTVDPATTISFTGASVTNGGGGEAQVSVPTPVESLSKNGDTQLTGDVTLSGGTAITLTQTAQDISIANSGVTSFAENGGSALTGAVTVSEGSGISITPSGNDLAIGNTGVISLAKSGGSALTGAVTISEGSGITITPSGNDLAIASTGGGRVPINPSTLTGLQQWFKADAESASDNDVLSTMTDQSGNGNNMTSSTTSHKPTFKTDIIYGKPVYRFGSSGGMTSSLSISSAPFTFISVVNTADWVSGNHRLLAGSNNFLIGPYTGLWAAYNGSTQGIIRACPNEFIVLTFQVTSSGAKLSVNGVGSGVWVSTGTLPGTINIGIEGVFGESFFGDLAEWLLWNTELTPDNLNELWFYCRNKYGM